MHPKKLLIAATLSLGLCATAHAHESGTGETVVPKFSRELPNVPGKSLIALEVDYAPGGMTPPHHHPNSSFIYAYVLSGSIRSQVEGEPARVYHAGEGWYEMPGAHHVVGENASKTEPARLLAVFVVDTHDQPLVIPDKK
jgi:quercetin dioxygenase-like cupin family protein